MEVTPSQLPIEVIQEINGRHPKFNKNSKIIVVPPGDFKLINPDNGQIETLHPKRLIYSDYQVDYSENLDTLIIRNPAVWGL